MWFGYNLQIIFVTFSQVELSHFLAFSITKPMDRGYLVGATPPTGFLRFFGNFTVVLAIV